MKPVVLLANEVYQWRDGRWKSNLESHIRYSAAAEIYKQGGRKSKIIICGGKIHGGDNPALSEAIKSELVNRYKIYGKDVLTETDSVDTSENAEYCGILFDKEGVEKDIILVTSDYHLRRSAHLFRNYGFEIEGRSAESILENKSPGHRRLIKKLKSSPAYAMKRLLDGMLDLFLYIPIGEDIIRRYKHRKSDSSKVRFP